MFGAGGRFALGSGLSVRDSRSSQEGYRLQPRSPCGFYETHMYIFFAGLGFGETGCTKAGLHGDMLKPQRYASS